MKKVNYVNSNADISACLEALSASYATSFTTHWAATHIEPVVVLAALRHKHADKHTIRYASENPILNQSLTFSSHP